ncbi:MAG: phosphatase PAP2 family protein [Gemmatimonadetes bacterium]|nr:phosphatase PAP2 family protein [Gemmatimonadota bacterium]
MNSTTVARSATERLFAAYALLSALALAFPRRPLYAALLAALHVAAAAVLLRASLAVPGARRRPVSPAAAWLRDWYPLLLIPALYTELAVLNRAVHGGRYFDPLLQRWEMAVFGGQPSRGLAAAAPHLWLSEALHGAYLSYYIIIYGPPLLLYLRGRRAEFRQVVFALMLTFFVHYAFFIYFPVQGPRYLFPAPAGEMARGWLYRLSHFLLEAGSSQGAAFPSSHVAVAAAQTWLSARYLPRLAPWVGVLTLGLALGAVYGGFHYATDAAAGLLLGVLLAAAAPAAAGLLTGRAEPLERPAGGSYYAGPLSRDTRA